MSSPISLKVHAPTGLIQPAVALLFVLTLAFTRCWGEAAGLPGAPAEKRPKNLLVLVSDDQRFDTIRALGNQDIHTPNLDRLVERGFVFTHACIMGSMQGAVCIPSRAMFLSGRSLWHVPENLGDVPTWPETFRQRGFTTFITGKWHNGRPSLARSFDTGRAIFFGGMSDHFRVPVFDFDPSGKYPSNNEKTAEKFSSELFADACIEFLRTHPEEKPFFAYVAFTAPHDPRTPPVPYRQMYDPADVSLPPNFLPEHPFDNGELRVRDELLASFPRNPEDIRRHIAEYYGMITHMDAQIGRIVETLESRGRLQETLIVFFSDNGLAVGQHGLLGKQNLYEHSLRVPLIFAGLGIPAGRSDALVYLHDVFPTVASIFEVPLPEGVEGQSLLPIICGQADHVRQEIFAAYRQFQRCLRTARYKYITYQVNEAFHEQLFDLEKDPYETQNLASDPALAAVKAELQERLRKARQELGDPVSP